MYKKKLITQENRLSVREMGVPKCSLGKNKLLKDMKMAENFGRAGIKKAVKSRM